MARGARARPVQAAEDVFLKLKGVGVDTVLNTGLDRETAELLVRGLGWDALGLGGLVTGGDVTGGLEGHPHSVILESVEGVPGWLADVGALAPTRTGWPTTTLR